MKAVDVAVTGEDFMNRLTLYGKTDIGRKALMDFFGKQNVSISLVRADRDDYLDFYEAYKSEIVFGNNR